jgi:hypothetical protein
MRHPYFSEVRDKTLTSSLQEKESHLLRRG